MSAPDADWWEDEEVPDYYANMSPEDYALEEKAMADYAQACHDEYLWRHGKTCVCGRDGADHDHDEIGKYRGDSPGPACPSFREGKP